MESPLRFAMPMPRTNARTSAVMTPKIGVTSIVKNGSKALLSRTSPVMGLMSEGRKALPIKKVRKPEMVVVP